MTGADVVLLIIDAFLIVGVNPNAASDLSSILANRDHRLPDIIVSQSGPAQWVEALPDKIAADSTVNRLADQSRTINLGEIDVHRLNHQEAKAVPAGTTSPEQRYQQRGLLVPNTAIRQPPGKLSNPVLG